MHKRFQQEMQKISGLMLNWPVNSPLKVGDYGTVDNNSRLTVRGNILTDGAQLSKSSKNHNDSLQIVSAKGVNYTIDQTTRANVASVDLNVKFKKANSVFANLGPQTISKLDNIDALGEHLNKLLKSGRWDVNYIVVTTVYTAKNVIVAGSTNEDANIVFGTEIAPDAIGNVLEKAEVNWSIKSQTDTGLHHNSKSEVDVFYEAFQLKKKFWSKVTEMIPFKGKYMGDNSNESEFEIKKYLLN